MHLRPVAVLFSVVIQFQQVHRSVQGELSEMSIIPTIIPLLLPKHTMLQLLLHLFPSSSHPDLPHTLQHLNHLTLLLLLHQWMLVEIDGGLVLH